MKEDGQELELLEVREEIRRHVSHPFRPMFHADVEPQPFRSRGWSPAGYEESLQPSLSDFAMDEVSSGYESIDISSPFQRLADFLTRSEPTLQARGTESYSRGIKLRRRIRKRKASSSPADELRSKDKAKYRK